MTELIMYTKTGCPWCDGAREFLNKNNVSFIERNVIENPELESELKTKSGQDKTPTFIIDGAVYADSSAEEIEPILREKAIIN